MAEAKCIVACLFFFLFGCIAGQSPAGLNCDSKFCRDYISETGCVTPPVHCEANNATHSGLSMLSPTVCNCCDYCLPFYGKDELCSEGGPGTGFTIGRCADGLTCVPDPDDGHAYCKRMESKCHTAQDTYDERLARGEVGALEMRPHCDGKGKFAPYDCIPANTCFCQSEEGERIFGEVLYMGGDTMRNMHCRCSRLHEIIKKTIAPGVPLPVVGPRCTSDGNFNPVQCLDRECYCVDTITGEIQEGERKKIDLDEHPISDLDCYDPKYDLYPQNSGSPPYNYTTPCLEVMKERVELIEQSIEDGYNVDFFTSYMECMPDGTYGRIAHTVNGEKICVDERGQQIEDYMAKPNTPEYNTMNCRCAQTSTVMGSLLEKPVCCKNGNFRNIQCRRGLCRCVDADGRQVGAEVSDVTHLSCYRRNWREC